MIKFEELDELDVYDVNEWFDIMRRVRPKLSREQFDADWDEFQDMKWLKGLH